MRNEVDGQLDEKHKQGEGRTSPELKFRAVMSGLTQVVGRLSLPCTFFPAASNSPSVSLSARSPNQDVQEALETYCLTHLLATHPMVVVTPADIESAREQLMIALCKAYGRNGWVEEEHDVLNEASRALDPVDRGIARVLAEDFDLRRYPSHLRPAGGDRPIPLSYGRQLVRSAFNAVNLPDFYFKVPLAAPNLQPLFDHGNLVANLKTLDEVARERIDHALEKYTLARLLVSHPGIDFMEPAPVPHNPKAKREMVLVNSQRNLAKTLVTAFVRPEYASEVWQHEMFSTAAGVPIAQMNIRVGEKLEDARLLFSENPVARTP